MKKTFITLMSILILFQGLFSYANVFFQINNFLYDFKLHQVKYEDDLTSFLSKHFGKLKEEHKNEHQKNHNHQMELNIHFDYLSLSLFFSFTDKFRGEMKQTNFYYKNLFSTFEKQKIFQPPQG